ncbi:MAG: DUF1499 domain-containing protein [Pseudomonadota bacterium]
MGTINAIVVIAAVLIGGALAAAGLGSKYEVWDYGTGLTILRQLALPAMALTGVASVLWIANLIVRRRFSVPVFVATIIAATVAAVPLKMKQLVDANPFIHDISTDFEDPPKIVVAAPLDRQNPAKYVGDELVPRSNITVSQAQQDAFADIGPVWLDYSVDESAEIIGSVVRSMGMEILHDGPISDGWRLEAADTSFWFGFVDDFIVRLRSDGVKTRIDVRSKSRVGGSDLGANANRVRRFYENLSTAIGEELDR